jgi:hypothetical protein
MNLGKTNEIFSVLDFYVYKLILVTLILSQVNLFTSIRGNLKNRFEWFCHCGLDPQSPENQSPVY